jgi:hypothetical protein
MGEYRELSSDHIFCDGEHFYFTFAVVNGERFDAQQLRVVMNVSSSRQSTERRDHLEKVIATLNRLEKRTTTKQKSTR